MHFVQIALDDGFICDAGIDCYVRELQKEIVGQVGGGEKLVLCGVFKDHVIVRNNQDGRFFRVELKKADIGEVVFVGKLEVCQMFVPLPIMGSMEKAVWSTVFVNDLPDSSFLYVEPGGTKDTDGKTVPRTLRHFPVRNADGGIDLPHLRNALARIPQSSLSQAIKDKLASEAKKLLENVTTKNENAIDSIRVVNMPALMLVIEDGKLDAGSIKLIEDIANKLVSVDAPVYRCNKSTLSWRGII
jgi:hypothetical protein